MQALPQWLPPTAEVERDPYSICEGCNNFFFFFWERRRERAKETRKRMYAVARGRDAGREGTGTGSSPAYEDT
jgi:hypothetical protein